MLKIRELYNLSLWKIYNQSWDKFTRNWCTLYTLFWIVKLQWWITVSNKLIKDTLVVAEKEKVWYQSWWAYFAIIYDWFVIKVFERTQVKINIKAVDINSKVFENLIESWYAFWLWLKNWNANYINSVIDWFITKEEIDMIALVGGWFQHNHIYFNWKLYDSIWSLKNQNPTLTLENLRYAVQKWIYYPTARTLVMEDKLLEKYLKLYKDWEVIHNIQDLPLADKSAIDRASQLRIFKK